MKRRDFITKTAGVVGAGVAGAAYAQPSVPKTMNLWKELSPYVPRPLSGTMPMAELGTTGIKISRYGFGSHIRAEMRGYDRQREHVIREAHELGVNVFDVYDEEEGVSKGGSYQYEPLSKQIEPFRNDVLISISFRPYDGRTPEEEIERDLKIFKRDRIDLVRILREPENDIWDKLFKWKQEGKIRAVGAPIHDMKHVDMLLGKVPIDYILFPYNFYHNICWLGEQEDDFESLPNKLRDHGVGVMTMKPFAGDYLASPFNRVAQMLRPNEEISFPQAALRYVINSGIDAACTYTGMFNLPHLYENVEAYYNPKMTDEEKKLLDDIRKVAVRKAQSWLPNHYKWLGEWAGPHDPGERDPLG